MLLLARWYVGHVLALITWAHGLLLLLMRWDISSCTWWLLTRRRLLLVLGVRLVDWVTDVLPVLDVLGHGDFALEDLARRRCLSLHGLVAGNQHASVGPLVAYAEIQVVSKGARDGVRQVPRDN